MSVSPEELAAYADGQLSGDAELRVAQAIAADPDLARQVDEHRALAAKLSRHFAPIAEQPVPGRLTSMLMASQDAKPEKPAELIDLATVREMREAKRRLPGWGWGGGAIAAALVAAIVLNTADKGTGGTYADVQLASVLDTQLVAEQAQNADTRILLSFRNRSGEFCRAYSQREASGIACRDSDGWRQQTIGEGASIDEGEYRMAASESEVLEAAQEMAANGALSAEDEAAARASGWTD